MLLPEHASFISMALLSNGRGPHDRRLHSTCVTLLIDEHG